MTNSAKSALSLALAIVGGIAAGMRCDASEWVENLSQTNPRPAAYTVKLTQKGLTLLYKNVFAAELMFGLVARASPISPRQ